MKSVNHHIVAQINARMFALQVKMFKESNLSFFKDFETLVSMYEKMVDMLQSTDISVAAIDSDQIRTIGKLMQEYITTKSEGGLFDKIDDNILKLFSNEIWHDPQTIGGTIYTIKNAVSHSEIRKRTSDCGIYCEYELGGALMLARELVIREAIKNGYGVIIYLVNKINDYPAFLLVWRNKEGSLGLSIDQISIPHTEEPGKWGPGHAVLMKNQLT